MRRILVTGGTGFIGRHCVNLLRGSKNEVYVVTSNPQRVSKEDNISYVHANLLDEGQCTELMQCIHPTHLLHLAWIVKHSTFKTTPLNIDWLCASLHLVKCFAENGGRRFVNAGSCMEYDWSHELLDEMKTVCKPDTLYGACKQSLYQSLSLLAPHLGLSYACGRVFFLFGPGENSSRFVSSLASNLLTSKKAQCLASNLQRDFLYVKDVASALVALLKSSVEGAVNIGSGEVVSLGDISMELARLTNKNEFLELATDSHSPLTFTPSVERLRKELKWSPEFSIKKALKETVIHLQKMS